MVLKAYIDDSVDAGNVLILAGYVASADSWARFSDDWQEILDMRMPYAIAAYHAANVGKNESEIERSHFLYRVIEEHVDKACTVCINLSKLRYYFGVYGMKYDESAAYHLGFREVVRYLSSAQSRTSDREPVDIIFDERGEKAKVLEIWDDFMDMLPDHMADVIGGPPSFQSDERILPLQAADMLAWHVRRYRKLTGNLNGLRNMFPWEIKKELNGFVIEPSSRELRRSVKGLLEYNLRKRRERPSR